MARRGRDTTRARMLGVALELFSTQGYDATTTREISSRLDMTPAAIYYHFGSKQEFLEALVDPYLSAVEAMLDDEPRPVDPAHLLRRYLETMASHREVAQLVDNDVAVARHPELGRRLERLTRSLRRALAGANASRANLVRASAALGALRRPALRLDRRRRDDEIILKAALGALGGPT